MIFLNLIFILLRTFQQPHCYTSVTSQLQEAEGFNYTVKPRFTAVFGGKETSAVNRGPRKIGVLFGLHYVCLVLFGGKEMAAVYRGLR